MKGLTRSLSSQSSRGGSFSLIVRRTSWANLVHCPVTFIRPPRIVNPISLCHTSVLSAPGARPVKELSHVISDIIPHNLFRTKAGDTKCLWPNRHQASLLSTYHIWAGKPPNFRCMLHSRHSSFSFLPPLTCLSWSHFWPLGLEFLSLVGRLAKTRKHKWEWQRNRKANKVRKKRKKKETKWMQIEFNLFTTTEANKHLIHRTKLSLCSTAVSLCVLLSGIILTYPWRRIKHNGLLIIAQYSHFLASDWS